MASSHLLSGDCRTGSVFALCGPNSGRVFDAAPSGDLQKPRSITFRYRMGKSGLKISCSLRLRVETAEYVVVGNTRVAVKPSFPSRCSPDGVCEAWSVILAIVLIFDGTHAFRMLNRACFASLRRRRLHKGAKRPGHHMCHFKVPPGGL